MNPNLNPNTGKKKRFFKVFKVAGKKCITTVKQKNALTPQEVKIIMVALSTANTQAVVDEYKHMNSRNDD